MGSSFPTERARKGLTVFTDGGTIRPLSGVPDAVGTRYPVLALSSLHGGVRSPCGDRLPVSARPLLTHFPN